MYCCSNCFNSHYLSQIIIKNRREGDCDYCGTKATNTYVASELILFFQNIVSLYVTNDEGDSIERQIILDFDKKVFSEKVVGQNAARDLLLEIFKDEIEDYKELFENPVQLKFTVDRGDDLVAPLELSWDNFSNEIIHINRFHLVNNLDIEKLKSLFRHFAKDLPKGKKFYRARIAESIEGFDIAHMGNPPADKARAGRANPTGISYLYLASDIKTSLYEIRASLLDYVSVGEFRLEENIQVINLSKKTYDPFILAENDSLEEVMLHIRFIEKLEKELSQPRRRTDSELEYLPTQYLSELIKSMGYAGIEYQSSLHSEGYNLAIFEPSLLKGLNVAVYDISDISMNYNPV